MKIGLVGMPKSGKTTLFNALTRSEIPVAYSGKVEPNVAVVKVLDDRITRLSQMYQPKKTVYATVEFVDFAGVEKAEGKEDAFSPEMMRLMRNVDALALVIRGFDSDILGQPASPPDELQAISDELFLSDLITVEKRLERIAAGFKKGQKTDQLLAEEKVLKRILEQLNNSKPIRDLPFTSEEETIIRGFQFLTKKQAIAVLNSPESTYGKNAQVLDAFGTLYRAIEFAGGFEMELSRLSDEEAKVFMADMGITESARERLIALAYEALGYISFFTVGPDEVRAWNIIKGETAVQAAGTIHTDLARGFIAAECFTYADLVTLGSEKAIKDKGKFRLEGKEYVVKDGDVLSIRFNV
jgi:hypothetical protein